MISSLKRTRNEDVSWLGNMEYVRIIIFVVRLHFGCSVKKHTEEVAAFYLCYQ